MQGYSYSIFSLVAIAIHLTLNFDLLVGRRLATAHGVSYRRFLLGVLAYYVADGAWGVFAGLGWTRCLYADSICFFLSNVLFALMWSRFASVYIGLGKWVSRLISWAGYALLAVNVAMLAANFLTGWVFYIDAQGVYRCGIARAPLFYLLIAFISMVSAVVLFRTLASRDSVRGKNMMVFEFSVALALAMALQVIWPLTPFTSLFCLVGNCFFNVFVVRDEQMTKHLAALERALERARSAEKARSMFFSIVSHDIRTPLNAILGYAELLRHGSRSEAERQEALDSIHSSGNTLLQLVNDVLDLAKMDAGKMKLVLAPVRLDRLTDDVFVSFRLAADGKGLELVNRTQSAPALMLDAHRFRQILFNLVGNAVKFTDHGSVTVSAAYSGGTLDVSVADTGCGIAPDMLTHILDPFVQAVDPSHSPDRAGGTGLGLSICRGLVEAMGGDLSVESEPWKGSTFRIRIPGVQEAGEERKPSAAEAHPVVLDKLPGRVLVVDDSSMNRSVLRAFLSRAGVPRIDFACDGEDALTKLMVAARSGDPHDFVFSDFWMPNMNGVEFIDRLRADSRFRRLPVFAVTADTECVHDPRTELFTGIIFKPMTYNKLIEAFSVL